VADYIDLQGGASLPRPQSIPDRVAKWKTWWGGVGDLARAHYFDVQFFLRL